MLSVREKYFHCIYQHVVALLYIKLQPNFYLTCTSYKNLISAVTIASGNSTKFLSF